MSTDTDTAITALTVAIIALVIAIGQITQQYFSTAEGFRRCQHPVMGRWAGRTKSKFRATELRYQTIFYTPHIAFVDPSYLNCEDTKSSKRLHLVDCDSLIKCNETLMQKLKRVFIHGEESSKGSTSFRASWLTLLEQLEDYQTDVKKAMDSPSLMKPIAVGHIVDEEDGRPKTSYTRAQSPSDQDWCDCVEYIKTSTLSLPAAQAMKYTWDFMPPDVVRPFATTTLGDLLILGHRLGLDWTLVEPTEGSLQAQDSQGNSISACDVRGLGILATFTKNGHRGNSKQKNSSKLPQIVIPTTNADKLAFGIIPGESCFGFDDVVLRSEADCLDFMRSLDPDAEHFLKASFDLGLLISTGIGQLLPIISPYIAVEGLEANAVRQPNKWFMDGVIEVTEGHVVFRDHLFEIRDSDDLHAKRYTRLKWILGPKKGDMPKWASAKDDGQWHWIEKKLANGEGFVWPIIRYRKPAELFNALSPTHKECTRKLEEWSEDFRIRRSNFLDYSKDGKSHQHNRNVDTKPPLYFLVRAHMIRAVKLRVRMEKHLKEEKHVKKYEIETLGKFWPKAAQWCQMMNFMLDEVDLLADEVLNALLGVELKKELVDDDLHNATHVVPDLIDDIVCAWWTMMFRALIFNRSFRYFEPTHARGKRYNELPTQWYDSQIPVSLG